MKRILTWFIIGKISLEVWNALLPTEQAVRIVYLTDIFVQEQSCSKVLVDIEEGDEVTISAKCVEVMI